MYVITPFSYDRVRGEAECEITVSYITVGSMTNFQEISLTGTILFKGDLARKKTWLFYCLSRKPLWKLSESKKPHSKIFSQSPKKRFFVFAWWRHTGAEGIISLYSIQNGKHINMGFCRFFINYLQKHL